MALRWRPQPPRPRMPPDARMARSLGQTRPSGRVPTAGASSGASSARPRSRGMPPGARGERSDSQRREEPLLGRGRVSRYLIRPLTFSPPPQQTGPRVPGTTVSGKAVVLCSVPDAMASAAVWPPSLPALHAPRRSACSREQPSVQGGPTAPRHAPRSAQIGRSSACAEPKRYLNPDAALSQTLACMLSMLWPPGHGARHDGRVPG